MLHCIFPLPLLVSRDNWLTYVLQLALSLQQQLSDFQSVEKEADEAQLLFNAKNSDKNDAETTLFQHFDQVQMQLDEE